MLGGCEKAVSCLTGPSAGKRGFQSAEGLQAEGKKAASPWVKAGEWFQISQWSTHKSPVTLSISGSSEDESSSHVLTLGVSSFLFFIVLLIIPFIFPSCFFFRDDFVVFLNFSPFFQMFCIRLLHSLSFCHHDSSNMMKHPSDPLLQTK